jgi:RNA polymerase sigma-70 factor (ECF subfamily)
MEEDQMATTASQEFHDQLIELLPRMRLWALAMTRNRSASEDLVQDVAMKPLMARDTFSDGTNFAAWMRRIMFNHFVSGVRRRRELRGLDDLPAIPVRAVQQDFTDIREMAAIFQRLPQDQKDAFRSVALEERTYEEVSEDWGVPVGTLKSQVHRARLNLRSVLSEHERHAA